MGESTGPNHWVDVGKWELRGSGPEQVEGPVLTTIRAFEVRLKAED